MQEMLKVENINVYYGNINAIHDVSFEVQPGEIVTLIGANGAGKSTILKTISGCCTAAAARFSFRSSRLAAWRRTAIVSHGLAQVPEGRRVFLQMSVEENLEMGGYHPSTRRAGTPPSPTFTAVFLA
jgi:branched-chain amino acid transport system ATP-binding protein